MVLWLSEEVFHQSRDEKSSFFYSSVLTTYLKVEEDIQGHYKGEVEESEDIPVDVENGLVVFIKKQCD